MARIVECVPNFSEGRHKEVRAVKCSESFVYIVR